MYVGRSIVEAPLRLGVVESSNSNLNQYIINMKWGWRRIWNSHAAGTHARVLCGHWEVAGCAQLFGTVDHVRGRGIGEPVAQRSRCVSSSFQLCFDSALFTFVLPFYRLICIWNQFCFALLSLALAAFCCYTLFRCTHAHVHSITLTHTHTLSCCALVVK